MIIVFGMFVVETSSAVLKEIAREIKERKNYQQEESSFNKLFTDF